jgi:type III secretory pathway component EscS
MELAPTLVEAFRLALWSSVPALAACALVAVLVTLVQSATQAQEPSLGFVPRLLVVLAILFVCRGFLADGVLGFAGRTLRAIAQVGR